MGYQITAPPGIIINNVRAPASQLQNIANGRGWIGFTYWNGGTAPVHPNGTAFDAAASAPMNSTYWGIELRCVQSTCSWPGRIQLDSITVSWSEVTSPTVTPASGPDSIWSQAGPGRWIWNEPGNAWQLDVSAADPSGVCSLSVQAGASAPVADSSLPAPSDSSWQECQQPVSWTAALDTREYVSGAGQMPLTLQATNAAGLATAPTSETLNVDNDPVSVSLSTPDDANPTVWVNHAVTVDATPSTGPSGLAATSCEVNGAPAQSYPAGGLTVDGDGVRTVSCTAWNNAVDPQGNHNSGTSSVTVHIDEAPPSLSFEPQNPADPTSVVVDASDTESGVAGGSIEMAPAGTGSWAALPTTMMGGQLVAHFNDAGLHGLYAFAVRGCDSVGNCGTATRTLMLPVRIPAVSDVSLEALPIVGCARPAAPHAAAASATSVPSQPASHPTQAARPGLNGAGLALGRAALLRHAPLIRVPIAAGSVFARATSWSSLSSHRPRSHIARTTRLPQAPRQTGCTKATAKLVKRANVAFGQAVRVHGLLTSSAGFPLAYQPVAILTAPDNGSNAFTEAAAATTGPDGSWTATLPPGPSRIIRAVYAGSQTVLPASGQASTTVPAEIRINISPRIVPWGSRLRITGRVLGGYVPTNSNLLRLNVGIGRIGHLEGLPKIDPDGRFVIVWKFDQGQGVLHPCFSVGTLSESAFPYAPGTSKRIVITLGEPTPALRKVKHHHRGLRAHHAHKRRKHHRRR
jgi:hypothetical protein